MKVVILAGGLGTRLSEETGIRPKPMVEIGGIPIICHIMKIYSYYGYNDFIICLGYKGFMIKEFFMNYQMHMSDLTINLAENKSVIHQSRVEPWKVTLVDTGSDTMTGGRIKRIAKYLNKNENFCLTYGDGLSDIDIGKTIKFHLSHGKEATLSATLPPGRFGSLDIEGDLVKQFEEKPKGDGAFVNGGFFVLNSKVIDRISGDQTIWEQEPLKGLAKDSQLMCYEHRGFWQPMDTLREKFLLENLWMSKKAPWKIWKD